MSYPRVNLLNKSEQRYQGAVSRSFIFIIAVIAPVIVIATLSSAKLIQYSASKSELDTSRTLWEDLEPKLDFYALETRGLKMNRSALDLFSGWQNSKASLSVVLDEVQSVVPENVQFTRLTIRSDNSKDLFSNASELQHNFTLIIDGKSHGALAENHVIGLQKGLLNCERVGSLVDVINLASLRKLPGIDGNNLREFRLEGRSTAGGQQ